MRKNEKRECGKNESGVIICQHTIQKTFQIIVHIEMKKIAMYVGTRFSDGI